MDDDVGDKWQGIPKPHVLHPTSVVSLYYFAHIKANYVQKFELEIK